MTDLRENLGWIIGSILTALAVIIGWMVQSGIVVALVSVLIGAGISYFVQTRTQKRVWKREYSIKIAETVYGSLYRDAKWVIWYLEQKHLSPLHFEEWGRIQEDYRYFMVDEEFRDKLDAFFERVRRYNVSVHELRTKILPGIINEEAEGIFKTSVQEIKLDVRYKDGIDIVSTSPNIIECLISQTHPKDYVLRSNPEIVILEFHIMFGQVPTDRSVEDKFDEFWGSCLKRMKEDKTYQSILGETDRLLEEARYVKKKLVERIQEPWKI